MNGIKIKSGPEGLRTLMDGDWRYLVRTYRNSGLPSVFDRQQDEEEEMYITLGPAVGLSVGDEECFLLFREQADVQAHIQTLWDAVPKKNKPRDASTWLHNFKFLHVDSKTVEAKKSRERLAKMNELKELRHNLRNTRRMVKELKAELEVEGAT